MSAIPHVPLPPWRAWLALVLGMLGVTASVCTLYAYPVPGAATLGCVAEALSCKAALTSQFSKVFGVPLGVFGVAYFLFWSLNLRAWMRTGQDEYAFGLGWATLIGAAVSVTLGSLMFFVLKAPCLYCLITHTSNLGALALLWPALRWRWPDFSSEEVWHFLALTVLALLAALTAHFANETRLAKAELKMIKESSW